MRHILQTSQTGSVFSADFMKRSRMTNPGAMKKTIERFIADGLIFQKDGVYRFFKEWLKSRGNITIKCD